MTTTPEPAAAADPAASASATATAPVPVTAPATDTARVRAGASASASASATTAGPVAGDAAGMASYYARRAAEYDAIYHKPERQADLRAMEAALPGCFANRRVLEIACGTGWWTVHAARDAKRWLATDLNEETLAVARTKPLPPCVELRTMDAFGFDGLGLEGFDAAFAGHWWSHLPRAGLPDWLELLHAHLEPGARVVMLDNRYVEGSSTPIDRRDDGGNTWQQRRLADGSTHEVLKNFPTEAEARAALGGRAQHVRWTEHAHFWVLDYTLS
jgi:SAM-dependent methyltransferase